MNYFLDLVYQLMAHPRFAMRAITKGEKLGHAGCLWLFSMCMTSLTSWIEGPGFLTKLLFCLCGMGLALILHSAVIDYCAGMLDGRGSAKGITAGFLAAGMPLAFTVFGGIFSMAGLSFLESLLTLIVVVWGFVLDVLAISENYSFSIGKAVLVACVPALLAAVFMICLFLLGAAAALAGLAQMGDMTVIDGAIQSF